MYIVKFWTVPKYVHSVASLTFALAVLALIALNSTCVLEAVRRSYTASDYCVHSTFTASVELARFAQVVGSRISLFGVQKLQPSTALDILIFLLGLVVNEIRSGRDIYKSRDALHVAATFLSCACTSLLIRRVVDPIL